MMNINFASSRKSAPSDRATSQRARGSSRRSRGRDRPWAIHPSPRRFLFSRSALQRLFCDSSQDARSENQSALYRIASCALEYSDASRGSFAPKARSRAARIPFARRSCPLAEATAAKHDTGAFFFFFLPGADNRKAVKTVCICAAYPRSPTRAASLGFIVGGSRACPTVVDAASVSSHIVSGSISRMASRGVMFNATVRVDSQRGHEMNINVL